METEKQTYDIVVKIVKEKLSLDNVVNQLRPICITLDKNESENIPSVTICQDLEATLNAIIDD